METEKTLNNQKKKKNLEREGQNWSSNKDGPRDYHTK